MSGLIVAFPLIAALSGSGCDAQERERKAAYDNADYDRALEIIDHQVECLRKVHPVGIASVEPGSLRELCLRIDVGFDVASRSPLGPRRALNYLNLYKEAGCLGDPLQRPRYRTRLASDLRRRFDDQGALAVLQQGEFEAVVAWFRHWDAPELLRTSLLWSIANSMATRAEIAAELRRPDELRDLVAGASAILESIDREPEESNVADVRNLLGWSILMAHEAGLETDDPTEMLRAALRTFKEVRPNATKASSTQINLALAALQHGRVSEADVWIEDVEDWIRGTARAVGDDTEGGGAVDESLDREQILMWLRIIQIRRTIEDQDPQTIAQRKDDLDRWQDDLKVISERGRVALSGWYAQEAAGRRHEAMGRADEALLAYERAEEELERYASSRRHDNEAVLAARRHLTFSHSTRRLVVLRLDQRDEEGALRAVRAARTRALRIADRARSEAGSQPNTSLPRGDELRLVFFQISEVAEDGSREWAGFAMTAAGARSERFRLRSVPDDLFVASNEDLRPFAKGLLERFAAEIEAAGSVEIVATGPLHHVPFHVLPWREKALIHALPVTYSLDLGRPSPEYEPNDAPGLALVLHGNERGLVEEAKHVSETITWMGAEPVPRRPESAEQLALQLAGASIAHFAVHGTRTVDRGLLRSDHRLHFGGGVELSQERILEGGRAPELVYLSACQSSFADAETLSGGVGLTQAFLLRGAQHVIGAVDDIDEGVAEDFAVAFYAALGESREDVPGAWQRAFVETLDTQSRSQALQLQRLRLYTR